MCDAKLSHFTCACGVHLCVVGIHLRPPPSILLRRLGTVPIPIYYVSTTVLSDTSSECHARELNLYMARVT